MLRLDSSQRGRLVVSLGESPVGVKRLESADGVLVAVVSRNLVPLPGLRQTLLNVYSYLVVVSQSELSSRKFGGCSFLSVLVRQSLVLLKDALISKQEPSTDTQSSLWQTLLGCQAVVVDGV